MRVLVLDEEIPYPQDSGKRIRVHALLTRMAKRHELTLLCYVRPGADDAGLQQLVEAGIEVVPVTPVRREQRGLIFYGKLVANLFSILPYVSWNYCSLRIRRQLRRLLQAKPFDLVHCEMTLLSPLLRGLPQIPSVAVAHNLEVDIWRRYESNETSAIRRMYIGLQRRRLERLETEGLGHITGLCAVSERDADWFRQRTPIPRIHVVPNGVDLAYFTPNVESEEPRTLVHAGSMDWRPNVDAITYFLEDIYPLILRQAPSLRFIVVGRNPSQPFSRFAARFSGVEVTGSVDDARPFMARGAVFVVPLRIGGGSRLKILNALAMGKAVVSTSIGAEGLEVRNGEHLLIADTPADFARSTLTLLRDTDLRRRLGAAGRALVEARYGWDAIADRLEDAWLEAASVQSGKVR